MLRSFAYARGAALRTPAISQGDRQPGEAELAAWERDARAAFLVGYRDATSDGRASFLPPDVPKFNAALAAWELDKALYEVLYELNHRPDWLALPLAAVLHGVA